MADPRNPRRLRHDPAPREVKGNPRIKTTFGKAPPRAAPQAAPIMAASASTENATGISPNTSRAITPIHKPAKAPTKNPSTRSRAVGGRCHHARSSAVRRFKKALTNCHLTLKPSRAAFWRRMRRLVSAPQQPPADYAREKGNKVLGIRPSGINNCGAFRKKQLA